MKWVKTLEVGCDGGCLSIFGFQGKGGWKFQFTTDETTLKDLLTEEDAKGMEFSSTSTVIDGWDNLIVRLDERYPDWLNMYPLECHPQLRERVWSLLNSRYEISEIHHLHKWREVLSQPETEFFESPLKGSVCVETYEVWEGYGEPVKKGVITLKGDTVELDFPDERVRKFYEVIGLGERGYTPKDGKEYIMALCTAFCRSSTIFIKKGYQMKKYKTPKLPEKSVLYYDHLLPDIKSGKVFPALRGDGVVGFYYSGGNLFNYKKAFSTHVKFATVLTGLKPNEKYIDENKIKSDKCDLNRDFASAYPRIKENCKKYQKDEASGVAKIYHNSSYAMDSSDEIVVLDIETSYSSIDSEETEDGAKQRQDRIDLLLYNKKEKRLRFYEAKHFSNKELWSKPKTKPEVVNQITRYNKQLAERKEQILERYKNYVGIVNELFNSNLPEPTDLDIEVVLLVFGFDNNQKERLNDLLIKDDSLSGLRYRFIGNPKSASDLWKNVQEPKKA